jgi:HK97 family phage major capsid protein
MTPEEIKALIEEQAGLVKQLREENDRLIEAGKNTQKEWTEKMQKLQDRLDEIDVKLKRPALERPERDPDRPASKAHQAFMSWCRHGLAGVTPEDRQYLRRGEPGEAKALTTMDETAAGFLASPEITSEIIKGIVEFTPIRGLARVRTTSQRSVKSRKRTGTFAAKWAAETGTKTETTGLTFGVEELPVHELYAMVDVSTAELEDSDFNLEAELAMEATEQFGVAEGKAFAVGTAVGQPEGIITNAAVGLTNSGDASLIKADGVIDLTYAVKQGYASRAAFLMRRATIGAVRKLKDTQNQYLWQMGIMAGQPSMLLGYPIFEAPDLDAIAANAKPIIFGDYRRGYDIVDRRTMTVLRDPFTQAASGKVRFIFTRRVGGQVVVAEAMRIQKVAA